MFTIQIPTPQAVTALTRPDRSVRQSMTQIMGHGAKPPQIFRWATPSSVTLSGTADPRVMYAGIEIETVTDNREEFLSRIMHDMNPWIQSNSARLWHAETDGSLPRDRGVEIPLMPWAVTTLDQRKGAYRFYDALWASIMRHRTEGDQHVNQCGMHIHTSCDTRNYLVNRSRVALRIEAAICALTAYRPGTTDVTQRLTTEGARAMGRPIGTSCSYFTPSAPYHVSGDERFRAVNWCNQNTVEMRAFGPAGFEVPGWLSTAVDIAVSVRHWAEDPSTTLTLPPDISPREVLRSYAAWLSPREWPEFPRACAHLRRVYPHVFI